MGGGGVNILVRFFFRYCTSDALRKKYQPYLVVCANATPRRITQLVVVTCVGVFYFYTHCASRPLVAPARSAQHAMQLHEFQATALSGRRVEFSSFAGKPVLFVNVASE